MTKSESFFLETALVLEKIVVVTLIENELPVPVVIAGPSGHYDKSYSGNDVFNIFTSFIYKVAELHEKRSYGLSARILHIL